MVTDNNASDSRGVSYERALQLWGASRLRESMQYQDTRGAGSLGVDPSTVKVEMEFNEGYACCGGSDPLCYCSFAESPSAEVVITGETLSGRKFSCRIDSYSFDFAEVLKEIVTAAGGTVIVP